jgi:hypothetical protein
MRFVPPWAVRTDIANGQIVERTRRGVQPGFGDVQVAGGGLQIAVAEQQLNAAQIGAGIEQMCREGMSQHMRAERLPDAQLACAASGRRHAPRSPSEAAPAASGKEPVLGLAPRQYTRSISSSFGDSITWRGNLPLPSRTWMIIRLLSMSVTFRSSAS